MSFWPMRCNSCNFLIDASASCDFLKYIYARETEKKKELEGGIETEEN